jgi:hypothetical protein
VINVAGDAFCHAELRVCGADAPERYTKVKTAIAIA